MVAIGLLDVHFSECGHICGCVYMGEGCIYMDITCLLPCGQETRACDQGMVGWDWAGGPRGLLSVAEQKLLTLSPTLSPPKPRARTFRSATPS